MRLIDADAVELGFDELCRSPYFKHDVNAKHGAETLMDVCVRTDSHMPNTIDPETIPLVRQLREELARVTAERDDYKELFFSYRNVCGGHDPQRISELVEADKDGRCVVLPCKVGTPVYWVVDGGVFECYLNLAAVEEVGKTVFLTREAAEAALAKEAK